MSKLLCRDCGGLTVEEEGQSLLFSSIVKRLQSEASQYVGDTSRGVVFVILIDQASCISLHDFSLLVSFCW